MLCHALTKRDYSMNSSAGAVWTESDADQVFKRMPTYVLAPDLRIQGLKVQLGSNNDRFIQRPVHGTLIREEAVYPICGLSVRFISFQFEPHVNSLDHEHIFFQLHFT
jgi:hypothetical protein